MKKVFKLVLLIIALFLFLLGTGCLDRSSPAQVQKELELKAGGADHSITVPLYTQLGHDEYMAKYHNEKYFLHFYSSYQSDSSLDSLTASLSRMATAITSESTYNKGTYTWAYVKWVKGNRRGAAYLYASPELQANVEPFEATLINTVTTWANSHNATITQVSYNPNDELLLRIVVQL
jgi:hypothetical protein